MSKTKKIINTPDTLVVEMCRGIVRAHPELSFDEPHKILLKKNINKNKVSLISGGGSGHEPAHGGFIGNGALDAVACGDVFASPSQVQVYNALKATASDKGTLMIVKNYSGDCMNFKEAAARAVEEGINVSAVYVNDDIAVKDSLYTVGRRGVAGTLFVHKIAGAAAEQGKSLAEVQTLAQKTIDNVRSFGFALTSCTVPAKGTPTFEIGSEEMEFGVGIHGEPGRTREKIITAEALAKRIIPDLIEDLKLKSGEEIALLVNGFGGTPLQELYVLNNSVSNELDAAKLTIYKTLVGNFMTSIDMAGASVTLLRLDAQLKALLDYPIDTPAFKWGTSTTNHVASSSSSSSSSATTAAAVTPAKVYVVKGSPVVGTTINTAALVQWIDAMADIIIAHEVEFCEKDSVAGDGDFGMSIAKGFRQLKLVWPTLNKDNIGLFLKDTSGVIQEYCGGASGPIWGSAFLAAGKATLGKEEIALADVGDVLQCAVRAIQATGERSFGRGAVVGDKTLIDALMPCADAVVAAAKGGDSLIVGLEKGAAAAVAGAEYTKTLVARMGRAGTVGDRSLGHPDAGAYGLGVIFTEMVAKLKQF